MVILNRETAIFGRQSTMKIVGYGPEKGKRISKHGSDFILSKAVDMAPRLSVSCAYIERAGRIGYHKATAAQAFMVVKGIGWVRAENEVPVKVRSGDVILWEPGEWHEVGSDTGLTAIVIEYKLG